MHFRLGVNVRHADQQLRGTVMLPHGTGRTAARRRVRPGRQGARGRGGRRRRRRRRRPRARIQEGWTDFDVAIATPDMMVVVGRLGRILGPQGKMPNPKTGTVTMDVAKAVEEVKAGKIEYRTDRSGIVHVPIGKKSFEAAVAGRELRRRARGDPARQAVVREGPLPADHHARVDDGPRRQGRLRPHPRPDGGLGLAPTHEAFHRARRPRPPAVA